MGARRPPAPPESPRRLVHTSDLHLDDIADRRRIGLSAVVDLATSTGADALLVVGDFFDSNRVSDGLVAFVVAQLHRFPGPVVVLAGNHDCLVADSVYNRSALWSEAPNVRILRTPGEAVILAEQQLTIWGSPLTDYGGDIELFPNEPPPVPPGGWRIGMAHGYFTPPSGRAWASFRFSHDDLDASGCDYVALGDWHAFRCVATEPIPAYYSGAPSSGTHTAAVVDLVPDPRRIDVTEHNLRSAYPA